MINLLPVRSCIILIPNKTDMKPIFSLLLIMLLMTVSCRPSANTAREIGNTVKKCCATLSMAKDPKSLNRPATTTTEGSAPVSVFSASVLERSSQILTW